MSPRVPPALKPAFVRFFRPRRLFSAPAPFFALPTPAQLSWTCCELPGRLISLDNRFCALRTAALRSRTVLSVQNAYPSFPGRHPASWRRILPPEASSFFRSRHPRDWSRRDSTGADILSPEAAGRPRGPPSTSRTGPGMASSEELRIPWCSSREISQHPKPVSCSLDERYGNLKFRTHNLLTGPTGLVYHLSPSSKLPFSSNTVHLEEPLQQTGPTGRETLAQG